MNEFKINDYLLKEEANSIACDAVEEQKDHGTDAEEYIWQTIDGHEWVIYTYKAIKLCAECSTDDGEQWLDDCGYDKFDSFGDHATKLAYATLHELTMSAYSEMAEA